MKIPCVTEYGNGITLSDVTRRDIAIKVIETIKKELPQEAQCVSVVSDIWADVKTIINTKELRL